MKGKKIAITAVILFGFLGLFMVFKDSPAVKLVKYAGTSIVSQNPEEDKQIKQLQEQIGNEMDKAIEEEMKKQSESNAQANDGSDAQQTQTGENGNSQNTDSSNSAVASKKSIEAKYKGMLEALRGASYGQINSLLGQAKGEYLSYPQDQREEVKYQLALKYLRLARGAESAADARFNSIAGEFESELKKAGHSTDIVDKARSQYKAEKRERMQYYISKAM